MLNVQIGADVRIEARIDFWHKDCLEPRKTSDEEDPDGIYYLNLRSLPTQIGRQASEINVNQPDRIERGQEMIERTSNEPCCIFSLGANNHPDASHLTSYRR